MSDDYKEDQLKEHAFDGIQEYDNQLPRWWVWKFGLCCAFGVAYFFWQHMSGIGDNLRETYLNQYKQELSLEMQRQNQRQVFSEEELLAFVNDPARIEAGKVHFIGKCASCHAADGGGLVGPNLTDDYWIHGNSMTDMVNVVVEGVPAKGMVPWKGIMTEEEIVDVVAFIRSIHGSDVSNPKAPEGELIPSM